MKLTSRLYSKNSLPEGIPYEDWIKKWWQWNISLNSTDNLKVNEKANPCPTDQEGSVLFFQIPLRGVLTATCKIPEGKSILVPLDGGIGWNDIPFDGRYLTDTELNGLCERVHAWNDNRDDYEWK